MNELRKKRLLMLATTARGNHKRWYSYFRKLNDEGLTGWCLGFAYLTDLGRTELKEMLPKHEA